MAQPPQVIGQKYAASELLDLSDVDVDWIYLLNILKYVIGFSA